MKSIGSFLKRSRKKKKITLSQIEEKTKIKREFLLAIEKEQWNALPDFPVVSGFVKNISAVLGIDGKQSLAFLRRDYPPKKLTVSPKQALGKNFSFSPRIVFFLGTVAVLAVVLGYLIFQYTSFTKPPLLEVTFPKEGELIETNALKVTGKTNSNATIRVNNQPGLINDDGSFIVELEVSEETKKIEVKAISRSGKESVINRNIIVELE